MTRSMLVLIAVVLAMLGCAHGALAATVADLTRAQESYDRGIALKASKPDEARAAFIEAAQQWQRIAEEGAENAGLYFNLGNAYVQAGDLGRGIACYLRGQRLDPLDRSINANLAVARTDVQTPISGDATSDWSAIAWWRILPEHLRVSIAAAAWIVFWMLVAAPIAVPGLRVRLGGSGMRVLRNGSLLVAPALGATSIADRWMDATRELAVIVTPEVVLRKGNGQGFEPQVAETLSPGIECRVLEERPGWLRVRLADGTEGWVRDAHVQRV